MKACSGDATRLRTNCQSLKSIYNIFQTFSKLKTAKSENNIKSNNNVKTKTNNNKRSNIKANNTMNSNKGENMNNSNDYSAVSKIINNKKSSTKKSTFDSINRDGINRDGINKQMKAGETLLLTEDIPSFKVSITYIGQQR